MRVGAGMDPEGKDPRGHGEDYWSQRSCRAARRYGLCLKSEERTPVMGEAPK